MSTFPYIRFESLPVDTETLRSDDSIVVVKNNTFTARIPADLAITVRSVSYPSDPGVTGLPGDMSWDDNSFYVYNGKQWGRIPFNVDWNAESGKFFDVSRVVNLSDEEVDNVWESLRISNTTVDSGTPGMVEVTSDINSSNVNAVPSISLFKERVLDIKGATGDTGPRGVTGLIGHRGFTGDKGDRGPVGFTGPRGYQGEKGPRGFQGADGKDGMIGPTGPAG